MVLVCDPQLGFSARMESEDAPMTPSLLDMGRSIPGADVDRLYFQQAVTCIRQLERMPDAVLIAGDMVDDASSLEQWQDYSRITASLDMPVYEAMGNHDGFSSQGLDFYRSYISQYRQCALITSGPTSKPLGLDWDGKPSERGFRVLDIELDSGLLSHEYVRLILSG